MMNRSRMGREVLQRMSLSIVILPYFDNNNTIVDVIMRRLCKRSKSLWNQNRRQWNFIISENVKYVDIRFCKINIACFNKFLDWIIQYSQNSPFRFYLQKQIKTAKGGGDFKKLKLLADCLNEHKIKLHIANIEISQELGSHFISNDAFECQILLKFLKSNSFEVKKVDYEFTKDTAWYILPDNVKLKKWKIMVSEGICIVNNSYEKFIDFVKHSEELKQEIGQINLNNHDGMHPNLFELLKSQSKIPSMSFQKVYQYSSIRLKMLDGEYGKHTRIHVPIYLTDNDYKTAFETKSLINEEGNFESKMIFSEIQQFLDFIQTSTKKNLIERYCQGKFKLLYESLKTNTRMKLDKCYFITQGKKGSFCCKLKNAKVACEQNCLFITQDEQYLIALSFNIENAEYNMLYEINQEEDSLLSCLIDIHSRHPEYNILMVPKESIQEFVHETGKELLKTTMIDLKSKYGYPDIELELKHNNMSRLQESLSKLVASNDFHIGLLFSCSDYKTYTVTDCEGILFKEKCCRIDDILFRFIDCFFYRFHIEFTGLNYLELMPQLDSFECVKILCNFLPKCPNLHKLCINFGRSIKNHDKILSEICCVAKKYNKHLDYLKVQYRPKTQCEKQKIYKVKEEYCWIQIDYLPWEPKVKLINFI